MPTFCPHILQMFYHLNKCLKLLYFHFQFFNLKRLLGRVYLFWSFWKRTDPIVRMFTILKFQFKMIEINLKKKNKLLLCLSTENLIFTKNCNKSITWWAKTAAFCFSFIQKSCMHTNTFATNIFVIWLFFFLETILYTFYITVNKQLFQWYL